MNPDADNSSDELLDAAAKFAPRPPVKRNFVVNKNTMSLAEIIGKSKRILIYVNPSHADRLSPVGSQSHAPGSYIFILTLLNIDDF